MIWLLIPLLLVASPADAGPLVAAGTAIFTAISSTTVGAIALRVAASLALSALSQAVARRQQPDAPGYPGLTVEYTVGEASPLKVAFGRTAVRGHALGPAYSTDLDEGGLPNKFLWRPAILSDMPAEQIEYAVVQGKRVDFANGITANKGRNAQTEPYVGKFYLDYDTGGQSSANAIMMANFSTGPRRWRSDMIGLKKTIVYPMYKADKEDSPWQGEPTPLYVGQYAKLKDPRTGTTAFTENPVVMIWNILRGIEIQGIGVWGVDVAESDMPFAHWAAAMDVCDELDGKGEPRYRAGLEFGLNQEPLSIIDELLKTCGGKIADCGGEWRISVGPPPSSVYSFTDGQVIVTDGREFVPFPGLAETYNGVTATYRDPRNEWEPTAAKPYYREDWETEDGRRNVASLELQVPYPRQVRRLMRELAKDNRRWRTHNLTLPPAAMHVMPLDTISWTSAENGYTSKKFEVEGTTIDPFTLKSRVLIRERNPSDYDFDDDFDDQLPNVADRTVADRTIYGSDIGLVVRSATIKRAGQTSRHPAVKLTWSIRDLDGLELEMLDASDGEVIKARQIGPGLVNDGSTKMGAAGLPNKNILVRARAVAKGRPTTWSVPTPITTPNVKIDTPDVTDFFATTGKLAIDAVGSMNQAGTGPNQTDGVWNNTLALLGRTGGKIVAIYSVKMKSIGGTTRVQLWINGNARTDQTLGEDEEFVGSRAESTVDGINTVRLRVVGDDSYEIRGMTVILLA